MGSNDKMNHDSNNTQSKKLTGQEVAKHNNRDDCWVIIHGKAYDVTEFLPEHPGGPKIILKYAGKDGTEEYDPIHPPDTLDKFLDKSKHLGEVDMSTVEQEEKEEDPEEAERLERVKRMPILEQCYNLMDFEAVARRVMKKTAWAYYSSGADDEITMRENHGAFHKIWFRPGILQDVENIDLSTTMLGSKVSIPFYVTATALGKLGNPEGEVVLTRGARKHNVIQRSRLLPPAPLTRSSTPRRATRCSGYSSMSIRTAKLPNALSSMPNHEAARVYSSQSMLLSSADARRTCDPSSPTSAPTCRIPVATMSTGHKALQEPSRASSIPPSAGKISRGSSPSLRCRSFSRVSREWRMSSVLSLSAAMASFYPTTAVASWTLHDLVSKCWLKSCRSLGGSVWTTRSKSSSMAVSVA